MGDKDEGIVAEVNMYLVVFREGICSVSSNPRLFGKGAESRETVSLRRH